MSDWLFVVSAFLVLLVVPMTTGHRPRIAPGRHRTRVRATDPVSVAARAARLNPIQANAVDAAVARTCTIGFAGNTIQLPCRECGRRAIPPVDYVDSPPIPTELATLVGAGSGWQVTATCTECYGPLISRVLDREYADHALSIGVVPEIARDTP